MDESDEEPRKVLALAKNVFKDFISEEEQFFLKIKDEEWGGESVDVIALGPWVSSLTLARPGVMAMMMAVLERY